MEGGKYGLKETKTYQSITMYMDLIWILSQIRCEKKKDICDNQECEC